MVVPEKYSLGLDSRGIVSVSLGYNGIELFPRESIEARQVGYSVDQTGRSLCDGSPGGWEEHWLVIGTESLCGDPVILDTLGPNLRVLFDNHGQGKWEPTVAPSLGGFWEAVRESFGARMGHVTRRIRRGYYCQSQRGRSFAEANSPALA